VAFAKKKFYRPIADFAAVYGLTGALAVFGLEPSYDVAYGLGLHLRRIRYQQAESVRLGTEAANSDARIPEAWFDGIAALEEEAVALETRENGRRAMRRAKREFAKLEGR
jgi:hypothetical protein